MHMRTDKGKTHNHYPKTTDSHHLRSAIGRSMNSTSLESQAKKARIVFEDSEKDLTPRICKTVKDAARIENKDAECALRSHDL